jgi:hypothetical protein
MLRLPEWLLVYWDEYVADRGVRGEDRFTEIELEYRPAPTDWEWWYYHLDSRNEYDLEEPYECELDDLPW